MDTIETADNNAKKQFSTTLEIIDHFRQLRKFLDDDKIPENYLKKMETEILSLARLYKLYVTDILSRYYNISNNQSLETEITKEYYMKIIAEDFQGKINFICKKFDYLLFNLESVTDISLFMEDTRSHKRDTSSFPYNSSQITEKLAFLQTIKINNYFEKKITDICKCGTRLEIRPEVSELWCPDCQKSKQLIGSFVKDDTNSQENNRPKATPNGTIRHYKFWSDRIQALERKTFTTEERAKIESVIIRDNIDRSTLNCEKMREILKDSNVQCTHLNQNAALLVKLHGGTPPPVLTFMENQIITIKFKKAMFLYEQVVPGCKNKPYYPYFIYKLYEEFFKNDPDKLRILDYIHLQSKETVTKNDILYEKMAALADPEDGIVYKPTEIR